MAKIAGHYSFKLGDKPEVVEHNKQLAAKLLADDEYKFEASICWPLTFKKNLLAPRTLRKPRGYTSIPSCRK